MSGEYPIVDNAENKVNFLTTEPLVDPGPDNLFRRGGDYLYTPPDNYN